MERDHKEFEHLHSDLINDNILPILPAKSLVRFTSACKLWYYHIKSSKFISCHLNINRLNTRRQDILIVGESLSYVVTNQILNQHVKLDFFPDMCICWNNPLTFCNGLIFITIKVGRDIEYLLWNPSINKSKKLESKFHSQHYKECDMLMFNYEIFGLGFHEPSNDHIVVRICYDIDEESHGVGNTPTKVDVFSLCTDSWHRVDSSPGPLIGCYGSVLINGAIHWLATTRLSGIGLSPHDDHFESILLFGLGDECFKEMALPEDLNFTSDRIVNFYGFQGSLAVLIYKSEYYLCMTFLWVMTDYGVTESWTRKLAITNEDSPCTRWPPMGLLARGIFVYRGDQNGQKVVFFDVDSGQEWSTEGLLNCVAVVDMMDNLVLLQGCNDF